MRTLPRATRLARSCSFGIPTFIQHLPAAPEAGRLNRHEILPAPACRSFGRDRHIVVHGLHEGTHVVRVMVGMQTVTQVGNVSTRSEGFEHPMS